MVRTVLFLMALSLTFISCRTQQAVEPLSATTPAPQPAFAISVIGDSVHIVPSPQEAPKRGSLGIGTRKIKNKNSGNVTVNITHTDKSRTKTKTDSSLDQSSVDKSKVTVKDKTEVSVKDKTDVVSKPTTTIKDKVDSKSKVDSHAKTKTTQGGQLALIGIGAAVVIILFLFFKRKSQ